MDRDRPGRVDLLVAAGWFLALAGAVFHASGWVVPFVRWVQFDNIYFQADIALVYANMTSLDSNHYRTGMHPLFSILMWPLVTLVRWITDASPSLVVRMVLALNAGAAAALVYLTLRRVTAARIDAGLFTLLFCVSASTVFWMTVPETFAFGGTTIVLMLAVSAWAVQPRSSTLVLANVATMSMTLTNWMVGVYATARLLWPQWRRSLRLLVTAGCVVVLVGLASKLVIPSSGYVGDFRRYLSWIRPPQVSDVRSFFAHSVVMPAPVYRTRGDGALEVVNEISAAGSGSGMGLLAVGLWLALLVSGIVAACSRAAAAKALRDILLLSAGSQLLLHVVFADGPFLYAAHFTPLLIVLAAFASRLRWSRVLVVATIATVSFNNLTVFGEMTDRLQRDLRPWLERHGKPMVGTPVRWDRTMAPPAPASAGTPRD